MHDYSPRKGISITAVRGEFPKASLLRLRNMGSFDFVRSFASECSNFAQDDKDWSSGRKHGVQFLLSETGEDYIESRVTGAH